MKNLFSSTKNENTVTAMSQQPEMFELSDQELEQANGGWGHDHDHRRWHREYRRERRGREVVIIVVEEYY